MVAMIALARNGFRRLTPSRWRRPIAIDIVSMGARPRDIVSLRTGANDAGSMPPKNAMIVAFKGSMKRTMPLRSCGC